MTPILAIALFIAFAPPHFIDVCAHKYARCWGLDAQSATRRHTYGKGSAREARECFAAWERAGCGE